MTRARETRHMAEQNCSSKEAETFTERARRMLLEQPQQQEFTLSRAGLEALVLDAERYAQRNGIANEVIIAARELVAKKQHLKADADDYLSGGQDRLLAQDLRNIAQGQYEL